MSVPILDVASTGVLDCGIAWTGVGRMDLA